MSIFRDYRDWKREHPVGGYVSEGLIVTGILRVLGLRSFASGYAIGYFLVVPLLLILSCFMAPCMVDKPKDSGPEETRQTSSATEPKGTHGRAQTETLALASPAAVRPRPSYAERAASGPHSGLTGLAARRSVFATGRATMPRDATNERWRPANRGPASGPSRPE